MKFSSLMRLAALAAGALAAAQSKNDTSIGFESASGAFALAKDNQVIDLLLDEEDWPGVHIAGKSLSQDFERVTGKAAAMHNGTGAGSKTAIIIGTIGKSKVVDDLVKKNTINVEKIKNKWESYQTQIVDKPCSGVDRALVISGSDKRGTIYGIYDLSEQIGVSPWYFFADVPAKQHDEIYALPVVKTKGEPSVEYRGIFINDEAPCLTLNLEAKFDKSKYDSAFVSEFYVHVFELLLRLKANTLWPASWNSMFNWDDRRNQPLASAYGIVMSTSHTEPLNMASNEWLFFGDGDKTTYDYVENHDNVKKFWDKGVQNAAPYEGFFQMGMRGIGDAGIAHGSKELLEKIVRDQQEMLTKHIDNTSAIPMTWSLYKEVLQYYNEGMEVPDDVTLLWSDDNFGNLRRLPVGDEETRSGGSGIYYHYEYVGVPRSYKWLNTIQLEQSWEQLHMSYQRGARKLWIVNVGDIKPLEMPGNYFLDVAYDFDTWGQVNMVGKWLEQWGTKTFGGKHGAKVGQMMDTFGKYAARKKFEQIQPETYSVANYQEADKVLAEWHELANQAWDVYNQLSDDDKVPFFEMVLHPIVAGEIIHEIQIGVGKNHLYKSQLRNVCNDFVEHVVKKFKEDHEWTQRYHELKDGKWDHIMDQTHLGFTWWQQPYRNSLPPMYFTQDMETSLGGPMGITAENTNGSIPGDDRWNNGGNSQHNTLIMPDTNQYTPGNRYFDIYARGTEDFEFEIDVKHDAVTAHPSKGKFSVNSSSVDNYYLRVNLTVDWDKVDEDAEVVVNITSPQGYANSLKVPTYFPLISWPIVKMPLNKTSVSDGYKGFVESGGYIAIEAEHTVKNTSTDDIEYKVLENYGRTLSGVTLFPVTCGSQKAGASDSPYLEYEFYSFSKGKAEMNVYLSPTLNHYPSRPMKYAVSIDDEKPQTVQLTKDPDDAEDMPEGWDEAVTENIWLKTTNHTIEDTGKHTVKLWALEPGVVFQRFVVDFGGAQDSYLGPPESPMVM